MSVAVGWFYVILIYGLFGHSADPPLARVVVVSFLVLLVPGFMLGRSVSQIWSVGLFVLIGLGGGVLTYAIYDSVVNHVDHNLFPIEIVFMAVFAMPGVIAGLGLVWVSRRSQREHQIDPP